MNRSLEWWFLMAIATGLFALLGWVLLKDLYYEHLLLFAVSYTLFVVLGDGLTALAAEKFAPTDIHIGPGERLSKNDVTSETAVAAADFDGRGCGRVVVRSEVWRARIAVTSASPVRELDELRVVGRDGLTLLVDRGSPDSA